MKVQSLSKQFKNEISYDIDNQKLIINGHTYGIGDLLIIETRKGNVVNGLIQKVKKKYAVLNSLNDNTIENKVKYSNFKRVIK